MEKNCELIFCSDVDFSERSFAFKMKEKALWK